MRRQKLSRGVPAIRYALVCALAVGTASTAAAAPDRPMTAATADKGTGCLVRDAEGNYALDPECTWHNVARRGADGALLGYTYQDNGTLPEGAPAPVKAISFRDEIAACNTGSKETVTPSGAYASNCHFKAE
jgi:hypothetical protein